MCRKNRPLGIALIAGGCGLLLGVILTGGFFAALVGLAAIAAGVYILTKKSC